MAKSVPNVPNVSSGIPGLDIDQLREAIQEEYAAVANEPARGFHFHTGRPLAKRLEYDEAWLTGLPEGSIESFAGTGNPFQSWRVECGRARD